MSKMEVDYLRRFGLNQVVRVAKDGKQSVRTSNRWVMIACLIP